MDRWHRKCQGICLHRVTPRWGEEEAQGEDFKCHRSRRECALWQAEEASVTGLKSGGAGALRNDTGVGDRAGSHRPWHTLLRRLDFYSENEGKLWEALEWGCGRATFILKDIPLAMWGLYKRAVGWWGSHGGGYQGDGDRKQIQQFRWERSTAQNRVITAAAFFPPTLKSL